MIRGLFIPDPDPDFLPIPDPGVKKAPDPGSGIRNTGIDETGRPGRHPEAGPRRRVFCRPHRLLRPAAGPLYYPQPPPFPF
jgi:hypothetical protein